MKQNILNSILNNGISVVRVLWPALLLLTISGCSDNQADEMTVRPVAVRVTRPVITDMEERLSYMGTVRADREVQVIAQVQGTVAALPKAEGARVKKGDVVVEIDAPDLQAAAARLRADRDYWVRRHEEDKRLVAVEALPPDQAEASLRASRSAQAALAEAEARLAKTIEPAAIQGRVLSWLAEPGQHVMPGQPILLLGNDALEVHVPVVEEDLRRKVKIDVPVKVGDALGRTFSSRVAKISPVARGAARVFTVEIPLPQEAGQAVRIGTSMQVDFILKSSADCVVVPVEAIIQQGGSSYIFLIRGDRAVRQEVTVGIEQEGFVEVAFDWNGQDAVAISNLGSLADGAAVFPVEIRQD